MNRRDRIAVSLSIALLLVALAGIVMVTGIGYDLTFEYRTRAERRWEFWSNPKLALCGIGCAVAMFRLYVIADDNPGSDLARFVKRFDSLTGRRKPRYY